jgi:hypothetical protein
MTLSTRIKVLLWALPTIVLINDEVVTIAMCKDDGMQPNICRGDLVIVDRTTPNKSLQPGNVILMRNPEAPRGATNLRLIRRIDNRIDNATRFRKFQYTKDDKNSEARDSSDFGSVPEAIILGKVLAVAFPPWRAGWTKST